MEEERNSSSDPDELFPDGRILPLNARGVTQPFLRAIAQALGLPERGSKDQLLASFEGKLGETHEVPNVQVVIQEGDVTVLSLVDNEGAFLKTEIAAAAETTTSPAHSQKDSGSEQGSQDEVTQLREEMERLQREAQMEVERVQQVASAELEAAQREKTAEVERVRREMAAEIELLRAQLKKEKERAKKLWALNCKRMAEQENLLVEKDMEIEELRVRLVDYSVHGGTVGGHEESTPTVGTEHSAVLPVTTAIGFRSAVLTPPTTVSTPPPAVLTPSTTVLTPPTTVSTPPPAVLTPSTTVSTPPSAVSTLPTTMTPPISVVIPPASTVLATATSGPRLASSTLSTAARVFVPSVVTTSGTGSDGNVATPSTSTRTSRKGRAPPIDQYTGEDADVRFDDWLPSLRRAADWNCWTESEQLMQLAGHLRGRASQEWGLLDEVEKSTMEKAIAVLRERLDQNTIVLAAQDFRHTTQQLGEKVADFVRRLERAFNIAYGRETLTKETREAFLYGQLQEGILIQLLQNAAVSGAQNYRELVMAAKNEEQRLSELKKRRSYQTGTGARGFVDSHSRNGAGEKVPRGGKGGSTGPKGAEKQDPPTKQVCYNCGKPGHFANKCWSKKSESSGGGKKTETKSGGSGAKLPQTRQVVTQTEDRPLDLLESSSDEEDSVKLIVKDSGSRSRKAKVLIQGFETEGIVDTGSEITILNGDLLKMVASHAHLKKKQLKVADKFPRTYDRTPFSLDGRLDLDITFGDKTMKTPVYIKMGAADPLLLSEGVCRQLGIVTYHPDVLIEAPQQEQSQSDRDSESEPVVPMVKVQLLKAVKLLPRQGALCDVWMDRPEGKEPLLLEPDSELEDAGIWTQEGVIDAGEQLRVVLSNPTGFTQYLEADTVVGIAGPVTFPSMEAPKEDEASVDRLTIEPKSAEWRKARVKEMFEDKIDVPDEQKKESIEFLMESHQVFALEEGELGATDLLQFEIDTGDATPTKLRPYRIPFAVRKEVSAMLEKMEAAGVIQPSSSPWASPIILVRKKDGSHRFCVDYRALNAVTKTDTFPLPCINDLLDQLGGTKYFSTLDLAAGYWQIRVHPDSQQKTAFITHEGLHEFRVMPFGLKNAPAAFQRLMQKALEGLNAEERHDYVSVYIDDELVFSPSWQDHIRHLKLTIKRLLSVGLKLRPLKCRFIRQEVEFLGHVLTPQGLKTSWHHVQAVRDFKVPSSVREVRQFLGLASYYRRFVPAFAEIAKPLHALTKKGAVFEWTEDCQKSFELLKTRLTEAPVLAYPQFDRAFTMETDASGLGLGAVLSQMQEDNRLHPVAYASRALSPSERNYGITDLETLAVVWAISHWRHYLYGQDVTVHTDHSAVCSILQNPNASGKHARWWLKVSGSGIKTLSVKYRKGKENVNADALSRSPGATSTQADFDLDVIVAEITSSRPTDVAELLRRAPETEELPTVTSDELSREQVKDPDILVLIDYLKEGTLPTDEKLSRKLVRQASLFTIENGILYYLDPKFNYRKRAVVPKSLRERVLKSVHGGCFAGHFSANRLYRTLVRTWYWEGMYTACEDHRKGCPQCCYVAGGGRVQKPPLQPIPVSRPF